MATLQGERSAVDVIAEAKALAGEFEGRTPGSDAEHNAAKHIEARLRELGRHAEVEAIETWPGWPLAYAIAALVAVAGSVVSAYVPVLGAALAFAAAALTFLDASGVLPTTRRLLGRRASQNVISWGDVHGPGALVLVAHYDAGPTGLALSDRWEERRAVAGKLVRRSFGPLELLFWAMVAVLVCCLLRLPGLEGTLLTAIQLVPTAALIVAAALLLDIAFSRPARGANDNASGVALALRLAQRIGDGRLEHLDVHLLFTGAQKAIADGMRSFLKRHRRELGRERTIFINLDEVGFGTVRFTEREGPLLTLRSHPHLTRLCREAAQDATAKPLVNRTPSDGYAARSAGFPAVTVSCRSALDRAPERLDEEAFARAEAFCLELIGRLDAELGPDLAAQDEETVLSESER
jgi:Peptidase family M28